MAPEPPEEFVARPKEFDALKRQLLDAKGDAVAITAALRGAGGYGKTTLAMALAHDPDIVDAYFDGVLWAELGETPANLTGIIADLIQSLTGARPSFETLNAAAAGLGDAIGDRRVLLIIDDVWRKLHLEPFLKGAPNATRLVTTRFDTVLPPSAARQFVDAMAEGEALALIKWGLPAEDVPPLLPRLQAMAARLGEWAQLLKLANGFLRERVKRGLALEKAIDDLSRRFDKRGLDALSRSTDVGYEERHSSVAKVIETSLELLGVDKRARFAELGVFPEDVDIPVGVAARLWAETGGLDEIDSEDLLQELADLSLLLSLDLERETFRFHDTTRQYLQDSAGADGLRRLHGQLVRVLDSLGAGRGQKPPPISSIATAICRSISLMRASARRLTSCCSTRAGCRQSWRRPAARKRWWRIMISMRQPPRTA